MEARIFLRDETYPNSRLLKLIPEELRKFAVFSHKEGLTIETKTIEYGNIRGGRVMAERLIAALTPAYRLPSLAFTL
jgi:uncharacterized protein YqfA (UPF0365 family)